VFFQNPEDLIHLLRRLTHRRMVNAIKSGTTIQLIEPMQAFAVQNIPEGAVITYLDPAMVTALQEESKRKNKAVWKLILRCHKTRVTKKSGPAPFVSARPQCLGSDRFIRLEIARSESVSQCLWEAR